MNITTKINSHLFPSLTEFIAPATQIFVLISKSYPAIFANEFTVKNFSKKICFYFKKCLTYLIFIFILFQSIADMLVGWFVRESITEAASDTIKGLLP